ncbi:MAG TPA: rhodanese-like domain-containing protein [Steroidobacteraceae bacterium]
MTAITQATPVAVRTALASGEILLVDVREPNEYALERIAGALLYPLSTFDPRAVPAEGRKIVVHCAAGRRSMQAAQQLVEAGHASVINLDGGLAAWKSAGLPLIRLDPATGQVMDPGRI